MTIKLRLLKGAQLDTRGVKVTADNTVEVADHFRKWLPDGMAYSMKKTNGEGVDSDQKVRFHIPKVGVRVAHIGDVVSRIKLEEGSISIIIIKKNEFEGFVN